MIPLLRAMQRRAIGASVLATVLVAGVVACAPDRLTRVLPSGSMQAPSGAARNVTPAKSRVLTVCTGDGPVGTYTYQLSNIVPGAGTRGTVTTPLGTTFTVPSATCVDAVVLSFQSIQGETDIPTSITVTQVGRPAGTNFKYVQATLLEIQGPGDVCLAPANFPCGADTQLTNPSVTAVINEFHGSVLSYFNDWGSLGDFVWSDTNGNGIQDAGEAGIAGQTVTLAGPVSATTLTGPNGEYAFTGLPAGTYTVTVATPAGMAPSPTNAAGSTPSNDSNGSGTAVTLSAGEANPTIDFGFVPPRFAIGDRVWSDTNGDGVQDAGEPGLNGVTVTITGPDSYTATATTAGDGIYAFNNLLGGTYTVCTTAGVPAGYTQTYDLDGVVTPNCATVVVNASRSDVDFGYQAPKPPPPSAACVAINAVAGSAIAPVTVAGSGGSGGPYTFSASGLPAGLTMSSSGVISGTPTVTGSFSYTVTVTDKAGTSSTIDCTVVVNPAPSATCVTITAVQGTPITPVTLVGTGGSGAPYTFSATFLPAGLKLSSTGVISGTSNVNGQFTYTVVITDKDGHAGTFSCRVTVSPPSGTGFTTYTQGGWGANPHGNNPGQLLTTNFSFVYPSNSVKIGATKSLTFTSAAAVINFLPQGSTPGVLTASATNPTTSAAGVLAGQLLALRLSVDFSAAGLTRSGLGAMRVASGKLAGITVNDLLVLANTVIGGNIGALPTGVTVADLNNVLDSINNNFDGGAINNGYLIP